MTEKQLQALVLETIREAFLDQIDALRKDMKELRRCSRESLNQIRSMRAEFRQNMEQLNQQLLRLMKIVETRLSEEDNDKPFFDSTKPWTTNDWNASTGSGKAPNFDRDLSYTEMQARLNQMEKRLGMLEKALQKN